MQEKSTETGQNGCTQDMAVATLQLNSICLFFVNMLENTSTETKHEPEQDTLMHS